MTRRFVSNEHAEMAQEKPERDGHGRGSNPKWETVGDDRRKTPSFGLIQMATGLSTDQMGWCDQESHG